jgi:Domain of unknown function (DUF4158)
MPTAIPQNTQPGRGPPMRIVHFLSRYFSSDKYPRLPSAVSVRELAEAFMPTGEEVSWACARVMGPGPRLALLVMLKCYQRLGYFPQLERVPPEVVEYVCAQAVEVVEDGVGPLGRQSGRMIRRCRELVRERTGAVWDPQRVRGVAESAMRAALLSKDNPG